MVYFSRQAAFDMVYTARLQFLKKRDLCWTVAGDLIHRA
jgi:hypothetical protein